jgi:hypothetical protein
MCVLDHKIPQLNLFENLVGSLKRKETSTGDNSCYFSYNCPFKETTSLVMVSHPQFYPHGSMHSSNKNFLAEFVQRMRFGFKLKQN